jgi:YidC/Oxa1 family membrane protein insertase
MFEGVFNKKFLIATVGAIAIIVLWDLFFLKDIREADLKQRQEKEIAAASLKTTSASNLEKNNTKEEKIINVPRISLKNEVVVGSLSLQGARFDDLSLTHYKETLAENSPNVKIFDVKNSPNAYYFESGWVASSNVSAPSSNTIWTASSNTLSPNKPIVLTWKSPEGITYKKEISMDDKYLLSVTDIIENTSKNTIEVFPFAFILRHNDPDVEDLFISHEGFVGYVGGSLERVNYEDTLSKKYEYSGKSTYLGFTDKYWLAAIMVDQKSNPQSRFLSFKDSSGVNNYQADYKGLDVRLNPGEKHENTTRVFVGPKEYNIINDYNTYYNLDKFDDTIDFGWFFFFTKPMIKFLLWIYHIFNNFGLAILIFTVIIRVVILPIAYKSYISMAKMKELQPKMKELKELYKNDMQKYNKELMALYKKEQVNPLSGCLPILLQIPIFFSIYKVIFISIELRHTPFWGWVQDMSVKDPTNLLNLFGLIPIDLPSFLQIGIWPILMGITMYFQQKLSTTQALDNIQQKVMNMMPIILVFVLAAFPVGLVIYWTWSNVISIVQQFFINKKVHKEMEKRKNRKATSR